jgi:type I restriction enzyme, S subunit
MAGEWTDCTLGDFISLQRGHDLPQDTRHPGNVPVIGSFGVTGHHNVARAKGPGVTIGRSGASFGTTNYVADDYWPLNTCMYVTDFKGNDPKFCFFLLQTIEFAGYNSGSAQPSLNRNFIYPIGLNVPRPVEQRRIANLLSALDDKIELNRRTAATLEEMAGTLFRSWFVDFQPVRAKAEGRPTGLPDATAALFPSRFGENGLPEGWGTAPFGDLYDVRSGNTPRTEETGYWGAEHNWATPRDMSRVKLPVVLSTERHLSAEGLVVANSGLMPVRSILLSTRAPIGYLAFAGVHMAINQGMAGVVEKHISTSYAWLWCKHNIDTFVAVAGGSTFPEISKGTLRALPMLQPSNDVLTAFTAQVDALVDRLIAVASENSKLASVRDTLLPKLISGELRIKNAKSAVAQRFPRGACVQFTWTEKNVLSAINGC